MSFASKDYTHGQTNAMIKKMKDQAGENAPLMFLRDELELVTKQEPPLFKPFTTFNLEAVEEHHTKNCFPESEKYSESYWRGSNLDSQTPHERKAHKGGPYKVESLIEKANYREITMKRLGISQEQYKFARVAGLSIEKFDAFIQRRLIEAGHTVEMQQIYDEFERFKNGATDTAIAKDNKPTIWFVDNYDDTISLVSTLWNYAGHGQCGVFINSFGSYVQLPGTRIVFYDSYKF